MAHAGVGSSQQRQAAAEAEAAGASKARAVAGAERSLGWLPVLSGDCSLLQCHGTSHPTILCCPGCAALAAGCSCCVQPAAARDWPRRSLPANTGWLRASPCRGQDGASASVLLATYFGLIPMPYTQGMSYLYRREVQQADDRCGFAHTSQPLACIACF